MHIKLYLVGRRSPDPRWSRAVLRLVGREDLAAMQNMDNDLSYRSFLIFSLFPLCPSLVHSHFSVFIKTDSRFCGYIKNIENGLLYRSCLIFSLLPLCLSPSLSLTFLFILRLIVDLVAIKKYREWSNL